MIPPEIYHKLLEITDNFAELCLPNKQKVILLSTSELALKFGRVITNQYKKALNQLTKLLNQYHLANDNIHGARFQNVGPLSIQDRPVVRPEIVSELRSRNTYHLDSREINDIECRALAMLREHSMLNPARNNRKSNKNKPCRREGHHIRTEKSLERSSNLTDDRISSDDGPDNLGPNISQRHGRGGNSFAWPCYYCQQTKYEAKRTAAMPKEKKRKHETYKQEKRKSRRNTAGTEYKARQDLDEGDADGTISNTNAISQTKGTASSKSNTWSNGLIHTYLWAPANVLRARL